MASGAETLARALGRISVPVVVGAPDRLELPVIARLRAEGIRYLRMQRIGAAVSAADGYARRTGQVGVVLARAGDVPLADLPEVAEAAAAEVPLLLLEIADTPPRLPGPPREDATADAPVEGRHAAPARTLSKADDVLAVLRTVRDAARRSPGGPVVLRTAPGYLEAEVHVEPEEEPAEGPERPSAEAGVEHVQLRRAGNLVDASQHVLIWAGGGALRAGAGGAVAELAEKIGAPIVTTQQAAGLLPARHPCLVGLPPHLPEVGALWDAADLVLAIGSDLDEGQTQGLALPQPEQLIAINVDPRDAGRRYRPDVLLRGDAKVLTKALADAISYRGGTAVVRSRLQELRGGVRERLRAEDPAETAFVEAVGAALPDRTTVAADPSAPGRWLAAFHEWTLPRTLLLPATGGHVGYAVPAALGVAATGTTEPVVAVTDDQGLLASLGELAAVAGEGLPLTVLVVDGGGPGDLRDAMADAGLPGDAMDRPTADLAATARTFGLRADAVDDVEGLAEALRAHVAAPDPTVLVLRARLGQPPTDPRRWHRTRMPV